jgi:uncharacterized protein (TIGR02001 family)
MNMKMLLPLIGLSFSASAVLAEEVAGLQTSIGLNAVSAYNWRGGEMSAGDPSIGASINLSKSGFFATYALTTVKLGGAEYEHDLVAGYGTAFGDVSLSGGLVKVIFSGHRDGLNGNDLSFGEVFVAGAYKGLNAKLARNIDSANADISRLRNGDVYGELSYMYPFDNGISVGAEVGYYWYDKSGAGANAKNGVSQELAKFAYQVNKNLALNANYQFGGKDASGNNWRQNDKFVVGMSYAF